ncbi:endonuclease/exonuclease/phosphatase family protein [Pseudogemmobacter bohemicus]|uniref:endonuclease/exonuclease/phosphatase family protein n=1 Tax=Pseudogemmobacter bohemicus TaxID=2250708 RepID=UPI0018E53C13|nr:endonuclease/exonuclease/phosphatase family protein [Pseudogemmobacter bohemicus]
MILPRLPLPPEGTGDEIRALPRSVAMHDAYLARLPAMTGIEAGGTGTGVAPGFPLTVAAWNLERCLFSAASAAKIATSGAAVVLLSEMDDGMARTGQRHTTADLAEALGMDYLYGVEFLELGLGSETERDFCRDDHNARGFHGNAALSLAGFEHPFLLRLPGERHWFLDGGDQPRLGERIAIGGLITTVDGPVVMVSTHLESVSTASGRAAQMSAIIDLIDQRFPGLPALIGGDLNTGNHIAGGWQAETLFGLAGSRGFTSHGGPEGQMTTRPSLITRWPDRAMKLDWFLTRGLQVARSWIVESTDPDGRPLSDHDMILIEISGLG